MHDDLSIRSLALNDIINSRVVLAEKISQLCCVQSHKGIQSLTGSNHDIVSIKSHFYKISYRHKISSEALRFLISINPSIAEEVFDRIDFVINRLKKEGYEKKWYEWLNSSNANFFSNYYLFPALAIKR